MKNRFLSRARSISTAIMFVAGPAAFIAFAAAAGMMKLWPLVPAVLLGIVAYVAAEIADEADKRIQIVRDMEGGFCQ